MRYGFFILLILLAKWANCTTIKIGKSFEIKSIKKGVEISKPEDTLLISAGVYSESEIEIKKPLTLLGHNKPVIDGGGNGIFHILTDSVTISGFVLRNVKADYAQEKAAFHVYRSKNFCLENNLLENVFFGFLIEKSKNGIVKNNKITGDAKEEYNSGNGIHLWHSSKILIAGNEVSGMRDGIYFEFVSNCEIENNHSFNNLRYGLHFMFSNENSYTENTFDTNGAGVAVMFSKKIKMIRNRFIKNWGTASYGLLLKEINDAEITGNLFEENTIAIHAEGSNRINYLNNNFVGNGWGIKISGACYLNIFEHNNFLYNSFDVSYQGQVNDNSFNNNYWSEYAGYDLDRNGIGDVPFRPVKLFSYIVNQTPETIVLLRSLFVDIINFSEKVSPVFTPDNLLDNSPLMRIVE